MSIPESSLPDAWVERIWATMRATYGAAFDRQWECPAGIDPAQHVATLKAHWGRELRGFQQNPAAIGHALDHLPEHPPNLPQFKALCVRRPDAQARLLPAPRADAEKVRRVMAGLRITPQVNPRAWAEALRERETRGERLTIAQRDMWRAALDEPAIGSADADAVWRIEERKREQAQRVAEYAHERGIDLLGDGAAHARGFAQPSENLTAEF